MLLHVDPQNENELEKEFSFELANRVEEVEDSEERRAITLKEAFDRTINKLGKEVEEEEEDLENMDADRLFPTNLICQYQECYNVGYEACLKSTRTL